MQLFCLRINLHRQRIWQHKRKFTDILLQMDNNQSGQITRSHKGNTPPHPYDERAHGYYGSSYNHYISLPDETLTSLSKRNITLVVLKLQLATASGEPFISFICSILEC